MVPEAVVVRVKDTQTAAVGRERVLRPAIVAAVSVVLVASISSFGAPAHALVYLALAAVALLGPKAAVQALALSWLATFLNPGIFSRSEAAEMLRWLVIASAFTSVALRSVRLSMRLPAPVIGVAVFSVVATTTSVLTSYAPDVSIVKVLSFFMVAFTVLMAFDLTRGDARFWRTWFVSFVGVIIVLGFVFVGSELGYTRNARGFQGLLNHPQLYGSFLAPVLAYLFFLRWRASLPRYLSRVLVAVGAVSLVLTQARVGAVALLIGAGVAGVWWALQLARRGAVRVDGRVLAAGLAGALVLIPLGVRYSGAVQEGTTGFVFKRSSATQATEAFEASRGAPIERSLRNFYANPVLGIGFGVPSDPGQLRVSRVPVLGIPLGAPVEKGFTGTAVLEELGIVGFLFFLIMTVLVLRPAFRKRSGAAPAALAVAAFSVTIGESVLFAVGGHGLMTWIFLGLAGVLGRGDSH